MAVGDGSSVGVWDGADLGEGVSVGVEDLADVGVTAGGDCVGILVGATADVATGDGGADGVGWGDSVGVELGTSVEVADGVLRGVGDAVSAMVGRSRTPNGVWAASVPPQPDVAARVVKMAYPRAILPNGPVRT